MGNRVKIYVWLCVLGCLFGCGGPHRSPIRVGVDPYWSEINTHGHQQQLAGFVDELLGDLAAEYKGGMSRIGMRGDSWYDDLSKKRIDVVISSVSDWNCQWDRCAVSHHFLELGPVCISALPYPQTLTDLSGKKVGVMIDDLFSTRILNNAGAILQTYSSERALLDAAVENVMDVVILDRLLACSYLRNLYPMLHIVSHSLNNNGLCFVALNQEGMHWIEDINRMLRHLEKNKRLQFLQEKWSV